MSICLCYKSAKAAACVHWQGPDRMPLSELHEAAPGNTLSASTERLPTVRPALLHKRRRKRAIPTLVEPPPLGSDLDRHWRLSTVQKRKNYHKYAFFEINISWSHHGERGLSVCTHHPSPLRCNGGLRKTFLCILHSTSVLIDLVMLTLFHRQGTLLKAIMLCVHELLMAPPSPAFSFIC